MKVPADEYLCLKQLSELWRPGEMLGDAVNAIWKIAKENNVELDKSDIRDYVLARAIGNVLTLVDAEDYEDYVITDPVDNWHTSVLFSMGYIDLGELQIYRARKKQLEE